MLSEAPCLLCEQPARIAFVDETQVSKVRCEGPCVEFEIHDDVVRVIVDEPFKSTRELVSRAAAHESARGRLLSIMTTAHFSGTAEAQKYREKNQNA
jgi:hypothetical protein